MIAALLLAGMVLAAQPPAPPPPVEKKVADVPKETKGTKDAEPKETKEPPAKEPRKKDEATAADEAVLKQAGIGVDGDSLLAFFKKRTLADEERPHIQKLIRQLGSELYRTREHAMAELIARGPVVLELLRAALSDADLEVLRRAEKCIQRILEKDVPVDVPPAAVRLLAQRKPPLTVETMLAFMPFADNEAVAEETRLLLAQLARVDGKAQPALVQALKDALPVRRAAAGEALARAGIEETRSAVRQLLADPDPFVRYRVSHALTHAKHKDAVPVLIATLTELPLTHAWQVEDVLYRLAEGHTAPAVSLGKDKASREKCRAAWLTWWKDNQAKVDLARLHEVEKLLGHTVVVLLDLGRVMELAPDNHIRWQVDGLIFPLDVQYLPGERILVAEYHAGRVTERNLKGEILWQKRIPGPLMAQRLPNGNTFIATDNMVLEVDRADKEIFSFNMPGGERLMKAMKLPNGEIACLTDATRIVRFDIAGKELHSFNVNLGTRLFGGRIHMLPSGRVLLPHNAENKVVEYDARGKAVWEVEVEQPVAAVRLPNGHTLVTTMLPAQGALEFDRAGRQVWSYRSTTRVTRAIRR